MLLMLALGALAKSAAAEDLVNRDRLEAVRDRIHPGYAPLGVRRGPIIHYPQLSVTIEARDDIAPTNSSSTSPLKPHLSTLVYVEPQWTVRLDGVRHEAGLDLAADLIAGQTTSEGAGRHGWRAQAVWRRDLGRSGQAGASLGRSRRIERPSGLEAPADLQAAVMAKVTQASVEWSHRTGPVRLGLTMDWREAAYSALDADNGSGDPSERDYEQSRLSLRLSRAITSDTALFVSGEVERREQSLGDLGISTAVGWRAGVLLGGSGLWRGEVAAGGVSRRIVRQQGAILSSEALNEQSGLALDARLTWQVTALTTVAFDARRGIEDRIVRGDENAAPAARLSPVTAFSGGLRIDHELRRNLVISGRAAWRDTAGGDGWAADRRRLIGLGAQWRLNRRLAFETVFERTERGQAARAEHTSLAAQRFVITMIGRL